MDDDKLMEVIGHEIGQVLKYHSKKAFKTQLLIGAAKENKQILPHITNNKSARRKGFAGLIISGVVGIILP